MKRKKTFILILAAVIIAAAALVILRTVKARISGSQAGSETADAAQAQGTGVYDGIGEISIDFSESIGDIKPLNGINNGPLSHADISSDGSRVSFDFDVSDYYKSMNIPFVRLHDTEYPYGSDRFIDIHCIFPDFEADVDDPDSYYFEASDAYIKGIIDSGAEVMFRLGESIDHSGNNTYINPPEDYDKWAVICEHIIRHYNEGWDNGFSYGIRYWEIWNEPDNTNMWTGTMEEYYRLYSVTAKHLKERFPEIKVGGPAFTGIKEETLRAFLEGIGSYKDVPLDFMSWHDYNETPATFAGHAKTARSILDEYGYTDTLSVCNEWNYVESWDDQTSSIEVRNSYKGAAYIASSLIAMQYNNVDQAMYYDGQYEFADYYCGLYGRDRHVKPGYYAFKYWGELRNLGIQAYADYNIEYGVLAAAASSRSGLRGVMIVNCNPENMKIKLNINDMGRIETVNMHRVYNDKGEKIKMSLMIDGSKTIKLKPFELIYIEL